MKRTINGTYVTYVTVTLNEAGVADTQINTATFYEKDEKKAIKQVQKTLGKNVIIVKCQAFTKVYEMDEKTFIKYATEVGGE